MRQKCDAVSSSKTLIIGALGIVFGDIGTSPLYAVKSCFQISGMLLNDANILGLISLFIWCLFLVVSVKYVAIVLKMDHQGEGGILALATLLSSIKKYHSLGIFLGILGAALFFGDGVVTPAISVLSAMEGIAVLDKNLANHIIPLTIAILTALFFIQRYGTTRIYRYFGPTMLIWFALLAVLGVYNILKYPSILLAFNPYYALAFLFNSSWTGFFVIGGVILVVTGAEALYADLGHFSRHPIKNAWIFIVFPSLILNYLGQGANLIINPNALENPFYLMAPQWAITFMIIIATVATIIASQSIITGIFSITYHCILLNYLPRMKIVHTSKEFQGQIYIPAINAVLYALVISAILKFQSSEHLSVAYGLCIASIMFITGIMVFLLKYHEENAMRFKVIAIFAPLFLLDIVFLVTNTIKLFEGAWYVLLISVCAYYTIYVWRKGSHALDKQPFILNEHITDFLNRYFELNLSRAPGTAFFLCRDPFNVPSSLVINMQHNKNLHEKVFFVSFLNTKSPYYHENDDFTIINLKNSCYQIIAKSGFMQKPDLNRLIKHLEHEHLLSEKEEVSIFLSKMVPVKTKARVLTGLSEYLYLYLFLLSQNATDFYNIPHDKVIELGARYKI